MNSSGDIAQPRVTVVDITDPADANAGIELIGLDAVQLHSTPFRARRIIVRLEASTVLLHSTNLRLRTRTHARQDLLAYVTFGPRARGTVNGLPVSPGLLLAVEPGSEVVFVTDTGWESITLLMTPDVIRAHLAQRQPGGAFRLPRGVETLHAGSVGVRRLFDCGSRLAETAERQPSRFERADERRAAEAELLETLMTALSAANDFEPGRGDRTRQTYGVIVKAVEDHALACADDLPSVTDLCSVAGVSERTLEYAFKEVLGLTPLAYLTRLRLNRVRQALMAASRGSTSVSAEALKWGFWHFGDFSRAYKACFGEAPSATLRRAPAK